MEQKKPIFYTINELVEILKISRLTISRYIASGELKAVKLGRSYMVSQEDLDSFIKGRVVKQ